MRFPDFTFNSTNRSDKNRLKKHNSIISSIPILCFIISSCNINTEKTLLENEKGIQHGIVYYKEGRYAAWPANNGLWSWDNNEILVGFSESKHDEKTPGLHPLDRASASGKYARSKDGGISWAIEDAYEKGQTTMGTSDNKTDSVTILTEKIDDFNNPDFILTFRSSHFYYSNNRGIKWIGPYEFPHLDSEGIISRTDYIVDGRQQLGAFLTVNKSNQKEGRVVLARTDDGALNWEIASWIGPEHGGFDIMPSSVRLSPLELITTIRTRTADSLNKITAYISSDNGKTWEHLKDPVADTGRGGSPPALVKLADGRLALGYAYRSEHGSRISVRFSSDKGRSWSDEIMLRGGDGASRDVGYPRMLQRPDGKLVIIYYWNNELLEGANPYRYIAYTIFDPNMWN
jgi:hypothetical protein